jgi:hypothetical protein
MLKLITNGLAICFSLASIWYMYTLLATIEQEKVLIDTIVAEEKDLSNQKVALNKEHAVRYSRERAKNQKLDDEKFEAKLNESTQQKARDQSVSLISDLETSVAESQKAIEEIKLNSLTKQKEFDDLETTHIQNKAALPALAARKNDVINNTENLRIEISSIKKTLQHYDSVTSILKKHFDQTTSSLFADKSSRNWLERGEFITISYMEIDLTSGLIGLPVGQEDGIMKDKVFAIRSKGDEICKIKIMQAELKQSVGSIVPLIGKPAKLLTISEFDLYHL